MQNTTPPHRSPALPTALPTSVAWLGYGGGCCRSLHWRASAGGHRAHRWGTALLAYGAVILSFVGALHWGFAMALGGLSDRERTHRFVWSVVPSLLAWPAVLLPMAGGRPCSSWVCGAPGARPAPGIPRGTARLVPPQPLRWRLTVTACVCLALGAVAAHG